MNLTSRERVQRALTRRDHDRVPRHDAYWKETIARWQREGLNGGVTPETQYLAALEAIGTDFHWLAGTNPAPFPGRHEVIEQDEQTEVFRDEWGGIAKRWKNQSGAPEHMGFECDSRTVWETRFKLALRTTSRRLDIPEVLRCQTEGQRLQRWCLIGVWESFEGMRSMIGDENMLIGMAEDPDWIRDVSRTFTDVVIENLDQAWAAGMRADGVWCYGDMAFKTATVCSPQMYKDLIWPDHKRLVDWAHAHRMKFIYHTDGDVNGVMDLYLAAGFDCLQPLEAKANMDIRQLCPQYGKQLAFFGNVDVMKMMTNDRALIEAEVKAKLAAGMATKGYVYHSDHSVPPQVSWETYQFIIQLLDKYGRYD